MKAFSLGLLMLLASCSGGGGSPSAPAPTDAGNPGADLNGWVPFPANNPWNTDISAASVDPNSTNLIASIGLSTGLHPDFGTVYNGASNGIPYTVIPANQAKVPVTFSVPSESDPGPYPFHQLLPSRPAAMPMCWWWIQPTTRSGRLVMPNG